MKKLASFVFALLLSHNATADYKSDILELCSIAKQGNFSQIQAKGQLQANGSIKLITGGGKAEVSFSKGDWSGIQQVLQSHQASDNVTARECVIKLMPYFMQKKSSPIAKSTAAKQATSKKVSSKPAAVKAPVTPPPAAVDNKQETESVQQETHGDKSPAINSNGDVNINY